MRQKRSESARERRIALYKGDHRHDDDDDDDDHDHDHHHHQQQQQQHHSHRTCLPKFVCHDEADVR